MEFEYQMLGKIRLIAPNYPADTCIDKAKLVTGCIDGFDTRELKVPGNVISYLETPWDDSKG